MSTLTRLCFWQDASALRGLVLIAQKIASGVFYTPYGTIEFTHTKRRTAELIRRTVSIKGRTLRIATKQAAISDLFRSGRNINMIDAEQVS
jgi:hypothetical protein